MKEPTGTRCNAKNRAGEQCKKWAINGKTKCKNHGGRSTGAPKENKHGIKHGLYSTFFSEEEKEALSQTDQLKAIDDAIELIQVQLYRLAKMQSENGDDLMLKEETDRSGEMGYNERKSERFDYEGKSSLLTGRLGTLLKLKAELTQSNNTESQAFETVYVKTDEQGPDEVIY